MHGGEEEEGAHGGEVGGGEDRSAKVVGEAIGGPDHGVVVLLAVNAEAGVVKPAETVPLSPEGGTQAGAKEVDEEDAGGSQHNRNETLFPSASTPGKGAAASGTGAAAPEKGAATSGKGAATALSASGLSRGWAVLLASPWYMRLSLIWALVCATTNGAQVRSMWSM